MSWELDFTTDWDRAQKLGLEGWEPFAVTAEHYKDSDGFLCLTTVWHFRRKK